MDDLALLNRARELAGAVLRRLEELMDWGSVGTQGKEVQKFCLEEGEAGQGIPFHPGRRGHSLSVRPASEEFGLLVH